MRTELAGRFPRGPVNRDAIDSIQLNNYMSLIRDGNIAARRDQSIVTRRDGSLDARRYERNDHAKRRRRNFMLQGRIRSSEDSTVYFMSDEEDVEFTSATNQSSTNGQGERIRLTTNKPVLPINSNLINRHSDSSMIHYKDVSNADNKMIASSESALTSSGNGSNTEDSLDSRMKQSTFTVNTNPHSSGLRRLAAGETGADKAIMSLEDTTTSGFDAESSEQSDATDHMHMIDSTESSTSSTLVTPLVYPNYVYPNYVNFFVSYAQSTL